MPSVELTPAKLAELKKKAEGCDPKYWIMDQHGDVVGVDFDSEGPQPKIATVDFLEDAEHIAAADPETVLAMVEEIEILKTALNLLMCQYYSTDLEHEDIDKLCKGQIEIAKKYRESEDGRLRAGLKPTCPHWQQDGDGINEWRRCCTNSSYTIPEGGEPSEFCPDCGGKVEVLDYDPNIESEAGQ